MNANIEQAVDLYIKLQDRTINPSGTFDKAGRFYLADRCDCCRGIRSPSARYPYSEMVHGRTAEHVGHLTGVPAAEIRRAARLARRGKAA